MAIPNIEQRLESFEAEFNGRPYADFLDDLAKPNLYDFAVAGAVALGILPEAGHKCHERDALAAFDDWKVKQVSE